MRLIQDMSLNTLSSQSLGNILPILSDLSYVNLANEPDIETSANALKLHKICQYTLQYLQYSIQSIAEESDVLQEKTQILNKNYQNRVDIQDKLKTKVEEFKNEVERLQ